MKNIEGEEVRLLVVGDPAYPLLDWLIKGYTNSLNLTPEQESFSVYLSSLRVGVEMAFGKLKSRWRVLLKRSDFHFSFAPTIFATCCALHNFCEKMVSVLTGWKSLLKVMKSFISPFNQLMREVSTVVDECYSSGERAVGLSDWVVFDGPESSTREERLEEVTSRMRGVSCRCPEALADHIKRSSPLS